jgi:hypothetical protein
VGIRGAGGQHDAARGRQADAPARFARLHDTVSFDRQNGEVGQGGSEVIIGDHAARVAWGQQLLEAVAERPGRRWLGRVGDKVNAHETSLA